MKNIKKLSLILALFLIFSSLFCITSFAEEKENFIIDTNTVYAEISDDYSFFPYDDRFYFINEEVGTFWVFQAENFNLENGVKNLTKEKAFDIYKYYFDIDTSYYDYKISKGQIEKVNGISSYVLLGDITSEYDECDELEDESGNIVPGEICKRYFIVYIFATRENTIILSYESAGEKNKEDLEAVKKMMKTVLINGTYFDNEKLSVSHNFTNSPTFEDALQSAIDNYDIFGEMGKELMVPFVLMALTFFCGPLVIIIIVAIVNIVKYSKNKKKLKRYQMTYGSIPQYKASTQNYGGYGYNQPVNQQYQPPVNPAYQQNPINQNVQQTPSYVTNAVENLNEQLNQPQQPVQAPEIQVIENNESAGE